MRHVDYRRIAEMALVAIDRDGLSQGGQTGLKHLVRILKLMVRGLVHQIQAGAKLHDRTYHGRVALPHVNRPLIGAFGCILPKVHAGAKPIPAVLARLEFLTA